MLDDAELFLIAARQKPGDIDETDERDVECVAETDETGSFQRRLNIQCSGKHARVVGQDADGLPPIRAKPTTRFWA